MNRLIGKEWKKNLTDILIKFPDRIKRYNTYKGKGKNGNRKE